MPKIWDKDGEENNEWRDVDNASNVIDSASDAKRSGRGLDSNLEAMVGLCSHCGSYVYIEDDMHQIIFSACKGVNWENPVPMTGKKQVRNCSEFSQKGQMSVQTMFGMATMIEPGEFTGKRRTAGFTSEELKEKNDATDKGNS